MRESVGPSEAAKWEAALTGAAPLADTPKESVHGLTKGPSPAYLDWIINELLRLDCDLKIVGPGEAVIVGSCPAHKDAPKRLPETLRNSLRRWREDILSRIATVFPLSTGDRLNVSRPRPGRVVEWVSTDGVTRACESEQLAACDWVQWRYRGNDVWHSPNGEAWRE